MESSGVKIQNRFWVIMFVAGVALFIGHGLWLGHLEKRSYLYDAPDYVSAYEGSSKTDPALVWMTRSAEYRRATNDQRQSMRLEWAKDYTDRWIGKFVRLLINYLLVIIPILVALSSFLD